MKETGGENGGAKEAEKDGAADQLKARILPLMAKLLSDVVQRVLEVTALEQHTNLYIITVVS